MSVSDWAWTTWTPAPSGWRSKLPNRLLQLTRLIPGRPLERRMVRWMRRYGHLGTLHYHWDMAKMMDECPGGDTEDMEDLKIFCGATRRELAQVPLDYVNVANMTLV